MNLLVLNGSPRKNGTVSILLKAVADGASEKHKVAWIDVYDLKMKPCIACMKCRPDKTCALTSDNAHTVGQKIKSADGLIVGTPTHWGNMSAPLKILFDRNVPVFLGEQAAGIPYRNCDRLQHTVAVQFTIGGGQPWSSPICMDDPPLRGIQTLRPGR
jgi:multimeric flavodoxin WrbA